VEALCDRISIVRDGRVVDSGSLVELRHLTRTTITADLAAPPEGLAEMAGVHGVRVDGTRVHCQVDSDRIGEVLSHLTALGVREIAAQPATLEELFLRHYQRTAPAGARAAASR
jgi:ABC-2 type transport system ATP-binding protein